MRGAWVVLLVVGIPAAAYFAYRSWKQDQERKQALFAWAATNGYSYVAEDDSWCQRWTGDPFGEGDHRRAKYVITGTGKHPFACFDYSYETHTSDSRGGTTTTTHRYTVTTVQLPTYLPILQVTPESVLTRIGHVLGLDDIDLESEDFNRKFRVHANDPKFASDVLTPRTMQGLLTRPDVSWRIVGTDIVTWSNGRLTPAVVSDALSVLEFIVDGIPSFVWKDHSS